MHDAFYSPLGAMLKINPSGLVPNHGFTTWVGPVVNGGRMIVSILWHGPDSLEVKETVVRNRHAQLLRSTMMDIPGFLALFIAHHEVVDDAMFAGPFTSADPKEHVNFILAAGADVPANHEHWRNKCRDAAESLRSQMAGAATGGSGDPWADLQSIFSALAGTVTSTATATKLKTRLNLALGETEHLSLVQDKPTMNKLIHFLSKKCGDGQIEGVFVGLNLATGEETPIWKAVMSAAQVDTVLKTMSGRLFANGEKWTLYEA